MQLEDVLDFVRQHTLAVIATASREAKPQAAVVEFGELDDLTIVFDTFKSSRKYTNMKENKSVAVVIGWDDDKTVQIEGEAEELFGEQLAEAMKAYFTKNPSASKFASKPEIAYFAIKPKLVRYTDVGQTPWYIQEFHPARQRAI